MTQLKVSSLHNKSVICVPAGGHDDKQQDTTCMSNESETDKTHGMVEEILNNTDLEDSTLEDSTID